MAKKKRHDVVIAGGGSAGAVLAARLTEDPTRTVLLLEGGQAYPVDGNPDVLTNGSRVGGDAEHDWGYTAQTRPGNPEIAIPRGKALGGSSAVNATVALRARADDFQQWADRGVVGWSYDEVLETYKILENTPDGDDEYRGRSGPLPVRQRTYETITESLRAFIDSGIELGLDRVDDPNGAAQRGVSPNPLTAVDGIRQSTALAYLTAEVRSRENLTIRGEALVDRVLFEDTSALGVVTADGDVHLADDVILSSGTYGSAAILLRSGVGPKSDLDALGIDVVADLPVGRRLQDHPFFFNAYALSPESLGMNPVAGALVWTKSSEARGDELDLHISATHLMEPAASPTGGAIVLAIAVVQPESVGTIALRSTDPNDPPVIDLNLLGTPRDRRRMMEGLRLSRRIASGTAFSQVVASELFPGDAVQTDDDLYALIDSQISTYAHPTSSVPMGGPDDDHAVVDNAGVVRGTNRLRVVDASIMPVVPSTATNLTTIMIAEHIYRNHLMR
ncbi:dehydrogenase [Rhodococcus sp. 06-462-5]|uniref:GMC family oxidoreductase n=1 Tax=unclassified Rhodococcus (in: high G+C Gram-positive bacteria) TaxID=192944 RepID=UPI000B9A62F3|nr:MULTISPECIES: GMC family oxidoreductase N-terminal domain-containing protein [unclassified Rhodococcus (in: high G+C Gram-positive bacteria)]OZC73669.1 dehydrogenase [Rhodococcus sp. 06-462-5]OZE63484.1 dehydrogenase [Rhodococcus sp. 02-925g]